MNAMSFWFRLVKEPLLGCGVGLSGVIFGLIVLDTHHSGVSQHSIFGLFSVPARVYPWALLVVWQLLVPQVSFLGHLGGIVVSISCQDDR